MKKKLKRVGSNAIDPATTSPYWGKKPNKKYLGVAGKGGNPTNSAIPEWMFEKELKED